MLSSIVIKKENLEHNIELVREFVGDKKKIIAVVKANAYGVGMREVVPILEDRVDAFAVDDVEELYAIRFLTEKPVYVLGYVSHEDIDKAVDLEGTLVVYDSETLKRIDLSAKKASTTAKINIKIDALLGRQGLLPSKIKDFSKDLHEAKHCEIVGVYAHFSNIEDTTDFSHAQEQVNMFMNALQVLKDEGFDVNATHISSTAGALVYDDSSAFTHVRIGIGLYGLWPSSHIQDKLGSKYTLKPAIVWKTKISQVKKLPIEHPIGYGLTYRTKKPTTVAIIPQGYSDGYDRKQSNNGEVLVHGVRCPILGRIAMNMFVVDVSHLKDPKREDEVVLLGKQKASEGKDEITAEEIANRIDTINYEVIARISPLIPRIVE